MGLHSTLHFHTRPEWAQPEAEEASLLHFDDDVVVVAPATVAAGETGLDLR